MTACAIRFRLDGPGPAAFLVDCEGELRVYARGTLGGTMPRNRLLALLTERGCRWVPAAGSVELNLDQVSSDQAEGARSLSSAVAPALDATFDGAVTASY